MQVAYFPGCTLSTKASGYDRSGRAVAQALGLTFSELAEWQCCGATFPLAVDNAMALIAPARLLVQAQSAGGHVTTLCAVCFHVLRRTQFFLNNQPQILERINWFTEESYLGQARVSHFLELLRDEITWDGLRDRVCSPLDGLRVAPYYGCLLLRPHGEIGLDDPEDPHILHDCLAALGCQPVDFPFQAECCGSYLTANRPEVTEKLAGEILAAARRAGAQSIVTACPLCQFNLESAQKTSAGQSFNGEELPVLYFTQLMAVALGLEPEAWGLEDQAVNPWPVLSRFRKTPFEPGSMTQGAALTG